MLPDPEKPGGDSDEPLGGGGTGFAERCSTTATLADPNDASNAKRSTLDHDSVHEDAVRAVEVLNLDVAAARRNPSVTARDARRRQVQLELNTAAEVLRALREGEARPTKVSAVAAWRLTRCSAVRPNDARLAMQIGRRSGSILSTHC